MEPSDKPLPAGWEMILSRTHGQFYYWNASLGQSQWEHPQTQPEPPMCSVPTPAQFADTDDEDNRRIPARISLSLQYEEL